MASLSDLFPPLGLRIVAGPLEMRGLTDDDLLALGTLAAQGIHPPDQMPFLVPWTDAPADQLAGNTAKYHWKQRADFSVADWAIDLGVYVHGELVGTQGLAASNYLVTRTAETGSWLGRAYQGHGIGTAMRQTICTFAFDHLDAAEITSGAFVDNPASLAVSRKVGYRDNGRTRRARRPGELAEHQALVLTPDDLVRSGHDLQIDGLAAVRRAIGLDRPASP